MQVKCPECAASVDGEPGAEMVCPACMSPFLVPADGAFVRAFDVQLRDGRVLHAVARHALREAIYAGRIDREARVRRDGGKWELIGGYREFATIFRVLGEDMGTLQGTRKLAGAASDSESRGPRSELPRVGSGPRSEAPPVRGPLSELRPAPTGPSAASGASPQQMPTLDLDALTETSAPVRPASSPTPSTDMARPAIPSIKSDPPAEAPTRRGPPSEPPFTGEAPRTSGPRTEEPRMRHGTARPPVEGARPVVIQPQTGPSKLAIVGLIAALAVLAYLLVG